MFQVRLLAAALLIVIAVTPAGAHDPSAYGGLFRSRDNGATWFPANPGRIVSGAIALAVSPVEPTHLLLATDSGLLRTRNAGLDWSLEATSLLVGAVFAVAFDADGTRALAATGSALFRSDDGQTWQALSAPAGALPARLLVPDRPGRVYLVGWQQLYASDDWGTTWNALSSPLPEAPVTGLLVIRGGPTVYAIAGERLWAKEASSAWRPADTGLPHGSIDSVAADIREPRQLWATARGQVFRSDDGGASWTSWGRPLDEARVAVRGVAVSSVARDVVLTTDRGLYRSLDGGARWEAPGETLPAHLEAWPLIRDPSAPGTLYAGFALIPYSELWRLAAERTTALARVGPMGVAGSIAFLALIGVAAAGALRMLWRYDRGRRTRAMRPSTDGPR
jgi:photosystem II stability/assembly factor-like uncharacterized protein